jgi:nicotinate-nucleotide adenylyltransferase
VLMMPTGDPPHKLIEHDPGREERYQLCRLAAEGGDWLDVSRDEVDRPGLSYTEDTLRLLQEARPGDELCLILGSDQAMTLPAWREPENVLRLAEVGVARRDGVGEEPVREALAGLAGGDRVRFFQMPRIDVSSSDVRERVAVGRPYESLVPAAVARRIAERGLYVNRGAAS